MEAEFSVLKDYYENIAIPTLDEFLSETMSIRRGKVALIVFFHVIDYISVAKKIKKQTLYDGCKDIAILANAANATKHRIITINAPKLKQSDQIIQKSSPGLWQAPFGTGTFYESNEVYLTFNDGSGLQPERVSALLVRVKKYFDDIIYT